MRSCLFVLRTRNGPINVSYFRCAVIINKLWSTILAHSIKLLLERNGFHDKLFIDCVIYLYWWAAALEQVDNCFHHHRLGWLGIQVMTIISAHRARSGSASMQQPRPITAAKSTQYYQTKSNVSRVDLHWHLVPAQHTMKTPNYCPYCLCVATFSMVHTMWQPLTTYYCLQS